MEVLTNLIRFFGVLAITGSLVIAQDGRHYQPLNHFTNPPPAGQPHSDVPTIFEENKNYNLGDPITITWVTNTSIQLNLVRDSDNYEQSIGPSMICAPST
jgi:hypothetical protein